MHERLTLNQWYQSPLGCYLIEQIKLQLDSFLATSFGYYALQLGCQNQSSKLMGSCRVNHVYQLGKGSDGEDILTHTNALPVASDSTDLVILMHALSQAEEPHAILREVNRVLIPDGKLIIIDFNPVSTWGIRHLLQGWLDDAPWAGHYYTARRLKDWTSLLGFDMLHHFNCGYILPFNYQKLISRSRVLSKFFQRWFKFSSVLNVMIFEKNTIPLTPMRKRWVKRQILPPKIVRPTVGRGMKYDK